MKPGLNFRSIAEKTGAVLLALLFWQLAAMFINSSILLVTPIEVMKRLLTIWHEDNFVPVIIFTFSHIALGYITAVLSGMLLAYISYRLPIAEKLLWPWVITFRSVPVASMVVIFLIWVSSRSLSLIIVFLVVFPIIYNNVLAGLKNLDRDLEEMTFVFKVGTVRKLIYIILPQIKSYILSACSVTAGMSWKAGVAAEIIGTPPGSVGKMLYQSKIWLDTDDLFAWTVILVVLSVLFEKAVTLLLKRILK